MSDESSGRDAAGAERTEPRPGPDALYGDNPTPPQLENGFGWDADPLLVAGHDAYVDGEYLYQDYVYDDHGADTRSVFDQQPEGHTMGGFYSRATGDYRYPSDPDRYGYNAADLLEFRARPTDEGIAYRITLNTMLEPDAAAVAIGVDTEADPDDESGARRTDWGYGLGELGAPVDHRLVTWGTGAELDGDPLDDDRLDVDVRRQQIEVEVPLEPGGETWRHYVVVGLWDDGDGEFREIAVDADRTAPGGRKAGRDAPPVFNVGFRSPDQEPMNRNVDLETLVPRLATVLANAPQELLAELEDPFETLQRFGRTANLLDQLEDPLDLLNPLGSPFDPFEATGLSELLNELDRFWLLGEIEGVPRVLGVGNWREHAQAAALADRDISRFGADVDFEKLDAGVTERDRPDSGFVTYLYPSRHDFGAGVDPHANVLQGRIQPYGVYVPDDVDLDDEDVPMVTALHSLGNCYTQYRVWMPGYVEALAEATDGVVFMPQTRGPGIWYKRRAELDVFEAWRDLEHRVDVDRSKVSVTGYSMGGFGAIIVATKNPDCFGRCFAVVGPPAEDPLEGPTSNLLATPSVLMQDLFGGEDGGRLFSIFTEEPENALRLTDNLRHVPMLLWHGGTDPLVPLLGPTNYATKLRSHGYRHQIDVFPAADHFFLALQDRWERGPDYLADTDKPERPARVTFRHVPEFDYPELDVYHDGAYWVTDVRTSEAADSGLVDATSLADGYAEPSAETYTRTGTTPLAYTASGVEWSDPEEDVRGPANALELELRGVETATIWVESAGLDPGEELTVDVDSDTAATLTFRGSFGSQRLDVEPGTSTLVVEPLERPEA
ncbi:prolyl oligopeptidase family serine peptidase [Natronomonas marina]|uniref:prolyl oligopeptidase family serine peptidase n=1 Tax=Natronomonas marina TaxID=2961939 RepID=UPI0020C9B99B|nr:prolyl oligopeptidase family serine peptidase [Natronomonas marina]